LPLLKFQPSHLVESVIYEVRLLRNVLTTSEAQPASYPNAAEFFLGGGGVKRSGREVYHWPPTCAKVKNKWSYTSTPAIRLQVVDTDDLLNSLCVHANIIQLSHSPKRKSCNTHFRPLLSAGSASTQFDRGLSLSLWPFTVSYVIPCFPLN